MGCIANISADKFPKQGSYLGKTVEVCFHYKTDCKIKGKIIRNDAEEPFKTIIQLENGWVVLATECQHSPPID